jgi:acyl carrier protein
MQSDFTNIALAWVREHKRIDGFGDTEITENTDLIATGLLDSIAFIDLFLFIEAQVGCKIDLTDVDPADFSTVSGLWGIVPGNHDGAHAHAGSIR